MWLAESGPFHFARAACNHTRPSFIPSFKRTCLCVKFPCRGIPEHSRPHGGLSVGLANRGVWLIIRHTRVRLLYREGPGGKEKSRTEAHTKRYQKAVWNIGSLVRAGAVHCLSPRKRPGRHHEARRNQRSAGLHLTAANDQQRSAAQRSVGHCNAGASLHGEGGERTMLFLCFWPRP